MLLDDDALVVAGGTSHRCVGDGLDLVDVPHFEHALFVDSLVVAAGVLAVVDSLVVAAGVLAIVDSLAVAAGVLAVVDSLALDAGLLASTVVVAVAVCMLGICVINTKSRTLRKSLQIIYFTPSPYELTFAGLHTLNPGVLKFVVGNS